MKPDMNRLKVVVNYGGNEGKTQPRYVDSGTNKPIYDASNDKNDPIDVDQLIRSLKDLYDANPDDEKTRAIIAGSLSLELCRQYCMALRNAGFGRTFLAKIQEVIDPLILNLVNEIDLNVAITIRDLLIHTVTSVSIINGYSSIDLSGFASVVHKFMAVFKILAD